MSSETAWPEGVIARYLTVGGATTDVIDEQTHGSNHIKHVFSARCTGALCDAQMGGGTGTTYTVPTHDAEWVKEHNESWTQEYEAITRRFAEWAQSHAEKCRAMPKPNQT